MELKEILESGEVEEVNLQGLEVRKELLKAASDGYYVFPIHPDDAQPGAIFRSTVTNRVSWKSEGGLVFRFRLQLEQ